MVSKMVEIKTFYGTFGNFKDLLLFMCDENLLKIDVEVFYNFSLVSKQRLFFEEVSKIVTDEMGIK